MTLAPSGKAYIHTEEPLSGRHQEKKTLLCQNCGGGAAFRKAASAGSPPSRLQADMQVFVSHLDAIHVLDGVEGPLQL